jgi:ribonuclease HII
MTARVAGIDEAGRGPLAGPVVAAAVILDSARPIAGLADSKTLSAARREALACAIRARATACGIGLASPEEIDEFNIHYATLLAMQRAVQALDVAPSRALVDGRSCPRLACPVRAIVRGDASEAAISAASILAKVTRDALMDVYAAQYPGYGFERHRGYPTAAHVAALGQLGPTPIHRRSFRPVAQTLAAGNRSG